ncbi:MAG: hypothetical protein FWJ34_00585 [Geminocystis sp. GBBB08]|nr:hypothetical protein [Geminocystis sp. GBBB08]
MSFKVFEVHNNYAEADFWLLNKGTLEQLGRPTKEYQSFLTGIKCNKELIVSDYGFYLCVYLHQQRIWQGYACSSINWQHLRIKDIRSVLNNFITV